MFRALVIAILAGLAALVALPGATMAATTRSGSPTKLVRYHGTGVRVPKRWPVFRLAAHPTACVRFNRHAVYLGRPGVRQNCPIQAVGRTEAILISPRGADGHLASASVLGAAPRDGSMARIVRSAGHVVITATWNHHPAVIRRALGLRSLRRAMLATNGHRPRAVKTRVRRVRAGARRPRALGRIVSTATPATPGQVFNGLGFDACTTPSLKSMAAWSGTSPFGAAGVYIGGTNAACPWGNLNASWVATESAAGWHLIPIYVGLQAPGNGCGCAAMSTNTVTAATQGTAAAEDAVAMAQALGIGTGNPIYFDLENYTRKTAVTAAVLAFLQAWTQQLHLSGYVSGVYGSGSSGVTDLVNAQLQPGYTEPDDIWIAHWSLSGSYVPTSAADSYVPSTYWANNQRLIQYYGGHSATYGKVTISVDSDYLDGATAAYGSGAFVSEVAAAPSVTVRPQANGIVKLTPRWAGEPGITEYQLLGGNSQTAMTPIESVPASRRSAVPVHARYAYFQVQALNSLGQVVGSSAPAAAPASVAIFGNSAYVGARGPVGVPVACLNTSSCSVQATIYEGRRLLARTGTRRVASYGGQVLIPLTPQVHRLVENASNRRLPVTVTVTSSTGAKVSRSLNLVPYTISGRAPTRRIWPSTALQVIGETSFVSNGWTGGILAACRASTPCVATTSVTLGGVALAEPRTQTLGAGEIGYLTYRLTAKAHALLRARPGNQLGARVTITSTAPSSNGAAVTSAGSKRTMALLSLDSFR